MESPAFTDGQSAYQVLGVEPDATGEDLKRAYRALMRRHHPDMVRANGGSQADLENAECAAAQINVAYALLADPAARADYDSRLAQPLPEPVEDLDEGWELVEEHVADDPPDTAHAGTDDDRSSFDEEQPESPAVRPSSVPSAAPWCPHTYDLGRSPFRQAAQGKVPRRTGLRSRLVAASITLGAAGLAHVAASLFPDLHTPGVVPMLLVSLALVLSAARIRWVRDRRYVAFGDLRPQHMYGELGPDPRAGRADQIAWQVLALVPAAVAVRSPDGRAPFSHVIVAGNRAAYLCGIFVHPGAYHWQSTTLIAEGPYQWIPAATVDWTTTARAARMTGRALESGHWACLFPTAPGPLRLATYGTGPTLMTGDWAPGAIAAWLNQTEQVIRHDRIVEAIRILRARP